MVNKESLALKIIQMIVTVTAVAGFFLVGWLLTAWLYPDEWFAEIPKMILELLGFKVPD